MKPLLLIDVDGPLNPYDMTGNSFSKYNRLNEGRRYLQYRIHQYKVRLSKWHGEELLKLADVYELVWATTWEHDANALIGPKIGLPELPVIEFDKDWPLPTRPDGTYFKTHTIMKYAAGRPFAWVDDEIGVHDQECVSDIHTAPFSLHWVDPAHGLRQLDFDTLAAWAASLKEGP